MNDIEQLLIRDIAAVSKEIEMTDADLRTARATIEERVAYDGGPSRRLLATAAAAAAVLVVGVVTWQAIPGGDSSPTPAPQPSPTEGISQQSELNEQFLTGTLPTPEVLVGVWRQDGQNLLMSVTADGRIRFDAAGRLFSDPAVLGTYELNGEVITVDVDSGSAGCRGETLMLRAAHDADIGLLRMVNVDVPCLAGPALGFRQEWEQVLPANGTFLRGLVVDDGGEWEPPAGLDSVNGVWYSPGEDHVLELLPTGDYTVVDAAAEIVDEGLWSLGSRMAQLRLESAGSRTCQAGDLFVLGSVEQQQHDGAAFMLAEVTRDDCGGGWADDQWVSLS